MSSEPLTASSPADFRRRFRLSAWLLRKILPTPAVGALRIETPNRDRIELRAAAAGPEASLTIVRWRCLWRLITAGEIGFADSYIDGDWSTPDLRDLLYWAFQNEQKLAQRSRGSFIARIVFRLSHMFRANTKRGSRRNIAAHYDLGNEFYRQWLDRSMSYSSAIFTSRDQPLADAQQTKLDRIEAMLDIKGAENVLEIGFGWGGVVERLAGRDCKITGLTLSTEQLAFSQERIANNGRAAQADLRLQDYRDVAGQFDRIVSIEMLEAVGEKYWPVYFAKLRECLKSSGTCVLQVITIAEDRFDDYRSRPDYIQRHIFPGGMLPTKAIIGEMAARAGLTLIEQIDFGHSYAQTLQHWRRRFLDSWPAIEKLGFDLRFKRMWEYYLGYCEVGFLGNAIDVSLVKLRG
jgi:cyclopropane-fatty-acyl-phospholipid synthase